MSSQFFTLLRLKLILLRRSFLGLQEQSRLKIFFIASCVILYFIFGIYFLLKAFQFVLSFSMVGELLMERIFYVYFFVLFVLLTISSFILTLSSVFASRETEHFLTLPMTPFQSFFWKFLEVGFHASWALVFLSVPLFVSYAWVRSSQGWIYGIQACLILLPFVLITTSLGFSAAILALRFLRNLFGKGLLILLTGFSILKMLEVWQTRAHVTSNDLQLILNQLLQYTNWSLHPFSPSTWLTQTFLNLTGSHGAVDTLLLWNLIVSCICVSFFGMGIVTFYWGHSAWSLFRSQGARKKSLSVFHFIFEKFQPPRKNLVLFLKDLQLFLRDPVQYGQFAVFFGILFLYVLNLRNMHYDISQPFWKNLITFLNLGSVCLCLATLSTRFLFPQISLEGKCLWIFGLSLMKPSDFIRVKYAYSATFSLALIVTLNLLSSHMLQVPRELLALTFCLSLIAGFTLPALSIGLGALFPDFKASSPAAIVSGFGGTLSLIASMAYVTILVGIPGLLSHIAITGRLSPQTALQSQMVMVASSALLSALLCRTLLQKGAENLSSHFYGTRD